MAPRVLMIVYEYYPYAENRVQNEAHNLVDAGFAVDVLCLRKGDEPAVDEYRGVRIYRLTAREKARGNLWKYMGAYLDFTRRALVAATRLHRKRRYHLIQVSTLPDFLILAALPARLMGAKTVLDFHDLTPEMFMSRKGWAENSPMIRLLKLVERGSAALAHRLLAVSEPHRDALVAHGLPAHKFFVYMNLPDPEVFRPCPRIGRDDGRFRLVYHGSIMYRLGLDQIVRAMEILRREDPRIQLVLYGEGDAADFVQEFVRQHHLEDQVVFHRGIHPMAELPPKLCQANAGIVPLKPDVFNEIILPVKLMEYVALGLPVIATRTRAIQHYFKDDMVLFVEPPVTPEKFARAALRLAQTPNLAQTLARNARRFLETHSWDRQKREYVAWVADLIGHPPPRTL